ncbi:MAG: glutamate--tRNA ligase [Gammaproteobacteria bacterium]|jgi:glutamyl-tRNA synthetase
MSLTTIKTRFAPSPTGHLHLGNMRTALFNYLLAKKQGSGVFLLRIEDTDASRSELVYLDSLMQDLRWLGLQWDEGPEEGGDAGPYLQAERMEIYEQYYQRLLETNHAYPCFCTEEQLALSRKMQHIAGQAPRYAGTCANLSKEEVDAKKAQGLPFTLRFRVPKNKVVRFNDLVKGSLVFQSDDLGDFIIKRSSDAPAFMFCNAIDDAMMQVSHAIRGEDHLTNTPRQILILEALGLPAPQYGHITLIVGPDNSPLSKRHGSKSVQELRSLGFLPEALNNYLARLGHYYPENHLYSLAELSAHFSDAQLGRSAARYDQKQLDYWQKTALARLTDQEIWSWLTLEVGSIIPKDKHIDFTQMIRAELVLPKDAVIWAKRAFTDELEYTDEAKQVLRETPDEFFKLAHNEHEYQSLLEKLKTAGYKGKTLFQPLRAALMGTLQGPELTQWWPLLPEEKRIQRLNKEFHAKYL